MSYIRNLRLCVDPGHGGIDPGCSYKDLQEKNITLDIAHKVKNIATGYGFDVLMTRDDDTYVPLSSRVDMAEKKMCDAFVSIHINWSDSAKARGIEVIYHNDLYRGLSSIIFAKILDEIEDRCESLKNYKQSDSIIKKMKSFISSARGLRYDVEYLGYELTVLRGLIPSSLVEVCFLSNRSDRALLNNEFFLNSVASGIVKGVDLYLL